MNPMKTIAGAVSRAFGRQTTVVATFAAPAPMTREQATMERMFALFATLPDPDEALRRAGIQRHQLRAVEMDDEVTAALDTRREALIGTPWHLEGGTQRHRAALEAELAPHMEALLRGAFAAVPYGYSVMEVVYRNDGGRAGIASVSEKPFEWFVPGPDGVNLRWKRAGGPMEGEPVDPRKFLLTVRQSSARNPYGEALLSRAYWPWFFRTMGWQYWSRWLERYGTPTLLGKTSGDPQAMAENLAAAANGGALAVGIGDEVSAIQPPSGAGHFEAFDAVICRRIQKIILGQTLTTDASTGGSYAAAKVADGVRNDRRNADIRLVSRTMQRLVDALWAFNGHSGAPPRFVMADDTGLERERAERDAILVEKVGVRLSPEYIAERYDLEPGEFEMVDPDAAAAPQNAPAGADDNSEEAGQGSGQFAASKRTFTPVQQGIEDGLQNLETTDPIPPELVRAAVLAASDEADLRARLAALVPQADPRFQQALERASFAAAVLGYVAAEELRS
jgi:phage gp29-like protein